MASVVTAPVREARIDVRLRPDQKASIARAADIKGVSITDFIVQNAIETATQTIRDYETWTLGRPDAELFFGALLNPPVPGERLTNAAKRYLERFKE